MNVTEVINEIKKIDLFKDLTLYEPNTNSQFGAITVPTRHIKDGGKNELKLGSFYSLFVAHMYKDDANMDEFFYLTFHRKAEQRDFRKHSFYPIEYNKIFASGNSVEEIITDFKNKTYGYKLK